MRKTATLFFTFAFVLAVSAAVFGQSKSLANTEWKLVQANGVKVTNSAAAIKFNADGTKFTGNTGCNQMFGSVTVSGRNIDFGAIGATKRMCKLMEGNVAESVFIKALEDTARFTQTNSTLRFRDREGRTLLRFTRVRENVMKLEDRKWVLEQIKNEQTFAPLPYAFLNFGTEEGRVGGDSSCNVFGGSYKVTGKWIAITGVISTMRACIEDNKMGVQTQLYEGLRLADKYEIRDGRLMLYRGDELLLTFRGDDK